MSEPVKQKDDGHRFDLFDEDKCFDCAYCATDVMYSVGKYSDACSAPNDSDCPLVDQMWETVHHMLASQADVAEAIAEMGGQEFDEMMRAIKSGDATLLLWTIRRQIIDYLIDAAKQ